MDDWISISGRNFHDHVRTGCGAHPELALKQQGREAEHHFRLVQTFRHTCTTSLSRKNGKVFLMLNRISTTSSRRMREWRYRFTILYLGAGWRWVARPLYPRGQSLRYPLYRRPGGPQSRCGRCEEEKIICPCWDSNPGRPASSPFLYRPSYFLFKQQPVFTCTSE
jgi:hypothetical protein